MGMNVNRQETARELQDGPTQVAGEAGTEELSCCFCGFYPLASARAICVLLWGWVVLKSYKPALVRAEGGVFKIHLLSELQERKQNERRDQSAHGFSSLLVSSTQTPSGVSSGPGAFGQPGAVCAEQVRRMLLPQRSRLAGKPR